MTVHVVAGKIFGFAVATDCIGATAQGSDLFVQGKLVAAIASESTKCSNPDWGTVKRRRALFAVTVAIVLAFSGCAERSVDEELLPTPVPTLDPEALMQAAEAARPTPRPTATPTPVPATPEPTVAAPAGAESTTTESDASPEPKQSSVIEYGGVVAGGQTEQSAPQEAVETPADSVASGEEITATQSLTATVSITDTTGAVETGVAAEESVSGTEPVTTSVNITDTSPATATEPANGDSSSQTSTAGESAENVDPKFAGMPPSMIEAMANADPRHGEMLTLSSGCTGCHSTDPNMLMAGPTWYNISANASTRVPGESAGFYLYTSVMDPNAHVVDGFQPTIMLQTYKDTLSETDLADIIAYLMTIRGR